MAGRGSAIICKIHNRLLIAGGWVAAHRPLSMLFLSKIIRKGSHGALHSVAPRIITVPCDECRKSEFA